MTRRLPPPAPGSRELDARLEAGLAQERDRALDRRCPKIEARKGLRYRVDGREVLSFCSNDYLGLADDRDALAGDGDAPAGSGASRLVCGDLPDHRRVEQKAAELLGYEDAVLFPSGFQANAGVPACLIGGEDRVFSDTLNHASLIDGLRLSAAPRTLLPHLERPPSAVEEPRPRASWWVCESVFSMDGDGPSLADLEAHLAEGGCLYLDEAHAIGLYPGGRGRAGQLARKPTVLMAPLGKALGCAGAFVCASKTVCRWIRGHARTFVFTTGVSPSLLPRIEAALELVAGPEGERRRAKLWRNVELFRRALGPRAPKRGLSTPIWPLVVGSNAAALTASQALLERGWHVQAIRPPTVPIDGARLRITLSAAHEPDEVEAFAADLREVSAAASDQS